MPGGLESTEYIRNDRKYEVEYERPNYINTLKFT